MFPEKRVFAIWGWLFHTSWRLFRALGPIFGRYGRLWGSLEAILVVLHRALGRSLVFLDRFGEPKTGEKRRKGGPGAPGSGQGAASRSAGAGAATKNPNFIEFQDVRGQLHILPGHGCWPPQARARFNSFHAGERILCSNTPEP